MMDEMYWKGKIGTERLMELIGHTPLQVIVGSLFGFLLSYILYQTM